MLTPIAHSKARSRHKADEGYVLLTLLLFVALLTIGVALPMVTYYNFQMKRDREEELVHRGVEYERAIRKYYKKFGTYPASLEALQDTNHIRCLRKRFKDPFGKDFKVLHLVDVQMQFGAGIVGAQTLGQPVANLNSSSNATPTPDVNATNGNPAAGSDSTAPDASQQGSTANSGPNANAGSNTNSGTTLPFTSISGQATTGPTFGGGGIVGVATTNPQESIRIYNKKNHYNEWLFAYNPSQDRGGLPKGPYQPTLQAILPGQLGQPGQNGIGQGLGQQGFGQQGFGQQGFGQGTIGQGMPTTPGRQ
jgi:type II secretory pathway pseudopilin PulG